VSNLILDPDSEDAREWLRWFLGMIADGGLWQIPRADTVYQILHGNKTMKRVSGGGDRDTEKVAKAIGWSVQV